MVLAGVTLIPATSAAGGFSAARFGGERAHPASDHPTAIYFNPAGLSMAPGTRLYLEGLFVLRTASYERPRAAIDNVVDDGDVGAGTPAAAVSANAGKGEVTDYLAAPFAAVVTDFGADDFAVGLGVYAPFGGQSAWDRNPEFAGDATYPGALDGVQRWHVIEGILQVVYVTGAVSYHLPEARLSIGASANVIRTRVETLRGRTAAGTDDLLGPNGELLEGRSLVDVSGTDLSFGLGVAWRPRPDLAVGASYQSRPGFRDQRLAGTLTNKFGAGAMDQSDIYLEQGLPDIVRAGAIWRARPDVEVRVQGDFQRWSVLENQCLSSRADTANCAIASDGSLAEGGQGVIVNIRRDWRDTVGVRAGGSWWPAPELEVGGSLAFDSNAVPDETIDPALMDMNKIIASASARYRLPNGLTIAATLLEVFYFERTVDPRTRDADGDANGFAQPSRAPDGAGTYGNNVAALTLAAEYAF